MHPLIATWVATAQPMDSSAGEAPALRHAVFFAGWLDSLARDATADARALIQAMALDFGNCELAWTTALRAERADLLAAMRPALVRFTELQGRWRDACAMLGAALASDALVRSMPALRLELLLNLSTLHFQLGDPHQCAALARAALVLARAAGEPAKLIGALNNIGLALLNQGQAALALPYFSEAADRARASGERRALGNALINAAIVQKALGALPECLALNEEALAVLREVGHDNGVAMVLNNLGDTLRVAGELTRARSAGNGASLRRRTRARAAAAELPAQPGSPADRVGPRRPGASDARSGGPGRAAWRAVSGRTDGLAAAGPSRPDGRPNA